MTAPPRIANPDDAAVVTRLLKAFFSHEGREVRHLRQNVEAILYDPGRGFFTLSGDAAVATTTVRISASGGAGDCAQGSIALRLSARLLPALPAGFCTAAKRRSLNPVNDP